MKHSFLKQTGLVLSASILGLFACHKDNNYNPSPTPASTYTPLQSYYRNDTSLSIFNAAVNKAGDQDLYGGSDSVTVLIPTNQAFRNAGITESTINSMSSAAVHSLLRYHLLNQSAHLVNGSYSGYITALGNKVYGYGGTTDSNYFNGSQASKSVISGSKATVYRLNTLLGVPYSTGSGYLASDTSYSYYQAALQRSGINMASDTGWHTILLPTNNAFREAGYNTLADINNADSAKLRNTLNYGILPGQYFTNSYNGLNSVSTSNTGSNITVGTGTNGATFTGTGNTTAAGFAGNNQLAGSNTVYQPVNGLVTP